MLPSVISSSVIEDGHGGSIYIVRKENLPRNFIIFVPSPPPTLVLNLYNHTQAKIGLWAVVSKPISIH